MIRVISSPSSSTTGLSTLIFAICPSFVGARSAWGGSSLQRARKLRLGGSALAPSPAMGKERLADDPRAKYAAPDRGGMAGDLSGAPANGRKHRGGRAFDAEFRSGAASPGGAPRRL